MHSRFSAPADSKISKSNDRINFHVVASGYRYRTSSNTAQVNRLSKGNLSHSKQIEWQDEEDKRVRDALEGAVIILSFGSSSPEAIISGLSAASKRTLDSVSGAGPTRPDSDIPIENEFGDEWNNVPMDTEIELSAEGGEHELLQEFARRPSSRPKNTENTWSQRIIKQEARWQDQLPTLVLAYLQHRHNPLPVDDSGAAASPFSLASFNVYECSTTKTFHQISGLMYTNATLLHQGYLGSAPSSVNMVISVRSLELYRQLRLRQPHLSVQAFLRAVCDMHNILHAIDAELDDETELEVVTIGAVDGGQSLKRVRLREGLEADPRTFNSSYYISETDVDRFKLDVKARAPKKKKEATHARWKAAMSDSHKRVWAIYWETGIFVAACRHGMIWWICDMVESGELAKYPLAIVDKVLRTFGNRIGIGYNIGCSFTATLAKSSLSDRAKLQSLRFVVNAFHGYAHNRFCFGIEDIETCECIFSAFNGLAATSRHATAFHRHQSIDGYAQQWDEDKYQELGVFLLNNYKQIQDILDESPCAIVALQSGKTADDTMYHQHLESERKYLAAHKTKEPEEDKYAVALKTFDDVIGFCEDPTKQAFSARLAVAKTHTHENLEQLCQMVQNIEKTRGVTNRWTPSTDGWKRAVEYLATRDYQKVLNKLEGLVVQHLFELAKMGLSGTGYKMRTHISKSLKTRCRAIQNALRKYNEAAKAIGRTGLEWSQVSTYGSLAEFELLRECREDIRQHPWADSSNRQARIHTLKIKRAEEERDRLNNEIQRLITSMRDEEEDLRFHITRLQPTSSLLAAELACILARRLRLHHIHHARLQKIFALPAFTGRREPGTHTGRSHIVHIDASQTTSSQSVTRDDEWESAAGNEAPDEDDAAADEFERLADYLDSMPSLPEELWYNITREHISEWLKLEPAARHGKISAAETARVIHGWAQVHGSTSAQTDGFLPGFIRETEDRKATRERCFCMMRDDVTALEHVCGVGIVAFHIHGEIAPAEGQKKVTVAMVKSNGNFHASPTLHANPEMQHALLEVEHLLRQIIAPAYPFIGYELFLFHSNQITHLFHLTAGSQSKCLAFLPWSQQLLQSLQCPDAVVEQIVGMCEEIARVQWVEVLMEMDKDVLNEGTAHALAFLLRATTHGRSIDRVAEDVQLGGQVLRTRRKPGINNAWAHCSARVADGDWTLDDPEKQELCKIVAEGHDIGYRNLSQEKQEALLSALSSHRDKKDTGAVRRQMMQLQDVNNTFEQIKCELTNVHQRCSIEFILFAMKNQDRHHSKPFIIMSEHGTDFISKVLKLQVVNVVSQFQLFSLSGGGGDGVLAVVEQQARKDDLTLRDSRKNTIHDTLVGQLHELTGKTGLRLEWSRWDKLLTVPYGVTSPCGVILMAPDCCHKLSFNGTGKLPHEQDSDTF
ncbi:hypothetical protein BV25DRAFT_1902184 [Artomyces pyxidatus]|uniref:Uncharacterized protein n=1 Tax=Artomyces pyxidatus TaxID=48021 RepID=A0ACB8SPZ3_9AGAM|nr:hypothetical protein BV25DRAFT_1902184 [Artomyces pyxidatus]